MTPQKTPHGTGMVACHTPRSTSGRDPGILGRLPARGKSGLTLVEVLLALAILGITAGVLMTAVSRCLAVVRTSRNYYEARRILELAAVERPLLVIKDENNKDKAVNLDIASEDYAPGYTFSRHSERSPVYEDLLIVRDRVTWSKRGKSSFEEVTTYLYYTNEVGL